MLSFVAYFKTLLQLSLHLCQFSSTLWNLEVKWLVIIFLKKCLFSVVLHIEAQLSLKNARLPPVFFLDFNSRWYDLSVSHNHYLGKKALSVSRSISLLRPDDQLLNGKGWFGGSVFKNLARRFCKMSSVDAEWPETSFATLKWHILKDWQKSLETIDSAKWEALMPNGLRRHLPLQNGTFWKVGRILLQTSNRFLENQPNKICSHLTEKASKDRFLKPGELQNHNNKGKGNEKKKERKEGKEEKRKNQWLHS